MRRLLVNCWPLLALVCSSWSIALEEDWEQEVVIYSQVGQLDRKHNVVIYTGNVVLTQGTLKIESDRLTVHSNGQEIEKAIAEGKPARYQQQIQPDSPLTHAEALTIEFYADKQEATLIGQAKLTQASNVLTGERIHYDLNTEVVKAGGGHSSTSAPERIKVIFLPKKKETNTANQPNTSADTSEQP